MKAEGYINLGETLVSLSKLEKLKLKVEQFESNIVGIKYICEQLPKLTNLRKIDLELKL